MIVSAIRKDSQTPSGDQPKEQGGDGEQEQDLPQQGDQQRAPAVPEGLKGGGQDDAHRGDGEGEGGHAQSGHPMAAAAPPAWKQYRSRGPAARASRTAPQRRQTEPAAPRSAPAWERRGRTLPRNYS